MDSTSKLHHGDSGVGKKSPKENGESPTHGDSDDFPYSMVRYIYSSSTKNSMWHCHALTVLKVQRLEALWELWLRILYEEIVWPQKKIGDKYLLVLCNLLNEFINDSLTLFDEYALLIFFTVFKVWQI